MIKRLSKVGGSLALVLEKPILDLYNIDQDTSIEVIPEKDGFRLKVIRDAVSDDELTRVLEDVNARYKTTLKNLA